MTLTIYKKFGKARVSRAFLFAFIILTFLNACSNNPQWRADQALEKIAHQNFKSETLQTSQFKLFTAYPTNTRKYKETLEVVIEGDGFAWANKYNVSDNPTPKKPVGLNIALRNQSIYLARPCQYTTDPKCAATFWSFKRFAPEVISSFDQALDILKNRYNANKIHLTGFSGGAYIALNLAAHRDDIEYVTTYAGVLDPHGWTSFHKISSLTLTHNFSALLKNSTQTIFTHHCGLNDKVVPCALSAQLDTLANHRVIEVVGKSHTSF